MDPMGEEPGRRAGLTPGQKNDLASLVSYQPGSVVSRTLIDRKAGTVTLFAFDERDGLSEHTSAYDALLYVLEGEVLVTVAGDSSGMGKGDVIILPAGRPHAIRAKTRFKMLLVMIKQ
jgi:quercetin dioxygenase-like cupin family protein